MIERRSKEIMLKIESEKELKIVCKRKTEQSRKPERVREKARARECVRKRESESVEGKTKGQKKVSKDFQQKKVSTEFETKTNFLRK